MVQIKDILNQDSPATNDSSRFLSAPGAGDHDEKVSALSSPNFSTGLSSNDNSDSDDDGIKCPASVSASSSRVQTPQSGTPSSIEEEQFLCKWGKCDKTFNQPETLYHHLCQDHVGRKSHRNLQLDCQWEDCSVRTEKRDHITSHLRVHVPLKPFNCSKCSKRFKRPQDLKKHLKVHMESHIIIKKKRGPKVGSRRVQKNKKQTLSPSPVVNHLAPTLPPITFQQWINNELPLYEPIYTRQLGSKLRTVLPSLGEEEALPRSSHSIATQNAAEFFTTLSKNMSSSLPRQYLSVASTPSTSTTARTSDYKRPTYPEIYHLPPIGPSPMTERSSERSSRNAVLPSLNSVPILSPRYNSFERLPHFNTPGQYVSSTQKNSGEECERENNDLIGQISSLHVDYKYADIFESLEIVNIIKDYLLCSLLEEEFECGELEEDINNGNSASQLSAARGLSKYPQIVI